MTEIFVKYLHFIGILIMSSALALETFLLAKNVNIIKLKQIAMIDVVFCLSAVLVLATGLIQWFIIGKPAAFYNTNYIFHIKITLFVIMVMLSIYPTIFLLKNRKSIQEIVRIPKMVSVFTKLELILLIVIPLLAVLIASNKGF